MRVLSFIIVLLFFINPAAPARENPPAKVVVSKITLEMVTQTQSFIGTLYYERISHVSSEVSGLVSRIGVAAGDRVKESEQIVTLDTQMLEKEILIQKNIIDRAQLNIAYAKRNFDRMDMLFKKDSVSEKIHDDAEFDYEKALLEKVSAQTTLEKLMLRKQKSTILAPFDGVILEKYVDQGDWVQQGKSLVAIGASSELFVRVPVAETLLSSVTTGQRVQVLLNAYNREVEGTIESLAPEADKKTKNVFLKIRVPSMTDVVENMSATVSIPTGKETLLFMLPRDAVVKIGGNDSVFTIQDQKAVPLPVNIIRFAQDRIGADNKHFEDGMSVVIEGNERLRPGQPVTVIREQ